MKYNTKMVYKKSNIKVLLGPENLKHTITSQGNGDEEFPPKLTARKPLETRRDAFGKIGESNIYKRTRPYKTHARPTLEKTLSNLELSGKKVETEEEKQKVKAEESADTTKTGTTNEPDKPEYTDSTRDSSASSKMKDRQSDKDERSQTRQKSKQGRSSANIVFSRNVLTDFGFSTQRTDTFSGHHRRRGVSADILRQFEEQAERHIRTVQTVGNVKRSSRANQGCQGLKHTVSPLQSPMSFYTADRLNNSLVRDKSFYRSDTDLDRAGMAPYLSQLRKHISKTRTISEACQKNNPLPGITNRTLIVGTGITIS